MAVIGHRLPLLVSGEMLVSVHTFLTSVKLIFIHRTVQQINGAISPSADRAAEGEPIP